ncbi:MAG: DNA-binding transcriptional LysR family regulator [Candidatus Azotimanducaceae bacterium]|jgi:DNA-binding transcriptional LysR family regulator
MRTRMNWNSVTFDWNHARAFLVTAEEGTLSGAALALGLTQPTLSRQVAALEAELRVRLFERVGQRLVLTDSGLGLLEYAKSMGDAASHFSLAATGQTQEIEGTVVVSTSELDAVFRLPKIIAKLRREEPGIEIEVVVTNASSDLKRREADIAIRSFRPTQNDLIARKLGEEIIWLYGTHDYLAGLKQTSNSSVLSDVQIIGFDRSNQISDLLNQQGWQLSKQNFQIVTSFQPMQIGLCKQGLGLIFLPEDMANEDPDLCCAFEHLGPVLRVPIWLVCHQELRTNRRIRRVYDFLANELSVALPGR